jgi:hypothetical protein
MGIKGFLDAARPLGIDHATEHTQRQGALRVEAAVLPLHVDACDPTQFFADPWGVGLRQHDPPALTLGDPSGLRGRDTEDLDEALCRDLSIPQFMGRNGNAEHFMALRQWQTIPGQNLSARCRKCAKPAVLTIGLAPP